MKVKRLAISNFRGVRDVSIDFMSDLKRPRQLTGLFGDNGAGKTTVLQALGLVIGVATGRSRIPEFPWYGFIPERISTLGRTSIKVAVAFDHDEIRATRELFDEWRSNRVSTDEDDRIVPPGEYDEVNLVLEGGTIRALEGRDAYFQFRGRYYAKQISTLTPRERAERFQRVGDVFWFDQYRNLGSVKTGQRNEGRPFPDAWVSGVETLREFLVGAWTYHIQGYKGDGVDYIPEIERLLGRVFPGVRIVGVQPRQSSTADSPTEFYFLFERGGRIYDLGELSSGEQAVIPLVYEFVRLAISRSIVLIDELELHLHPPEQQALAALLPKLGADCQFIVSSHSPYLVDILPAEAQVRVKDGRSCP